MQQYVGFYLLQITLHVSGVYRTHHQEYIKLLTAASVTGNNNRATNFRLRGLIRPRRLKVVAAVTVLCTPDDGCGRRPKHVE